MPDELGTPNVGDETFASRLRWLIDHVRPPDRGPYSYREIAVGTQGHSGAMTHGTIAKYLDGSRQDPRLRHAEALAAFFGVPVTYFSSSETAAQVQKQVTDVVAWQQTEVGQLAERVAALKPRDQAMISGLVDQLNAYVDRPRTTRRRRKHDNGDE